MKNKIIKRVLLIVLVAFFTVGIPIIINESYKANCGYITVWDGADVLSYYGAIVGALITVFTLVATISFTKKQIQRESYLNYEKEKWAKIEAVFAQIIESINPMYTLQKTMDDGFSEPNKAINILQKYQLSCGMAMDQLSAYLNAVDLPYVKELLEKIKLTTKSLSNVSQHGIDEYTKLRDLKHRSIAEQMISSELKHPGSFSQEDIEESYQVIEKTNSIKYKDIEEALHQFSEEIIREYEITYKELLRAKGSTFERVNLQILINADEILNAGRK